MAKFLEIYIRINKSLTLASMKGEQAAIVMRLSLLFACPPRASLLNPESLEDTAMYS